MAQWLIWLDGEVVHQPVTTERHVISATLSLALDSAGSLEADVPVSHPLYQTIATLPILGANTWRVERDGAEVFRGRLLSRDRIPLDEAVHVVVEGDLAMLNDSICRPYDFSGSPAQYVTQLIGSHNAQVEPWKRFVVGDVDIVDKGGNGYIVRGSESSTTTWEELSKKTIESSDGGHLVLRRGTHVIDWLTSVATTCDQPVRLGWNMLGLEDGSDGSELVTAIIPVGADVGGARLTISPTRSGGVGVTVRDGIVINDVLAASNGTVVREVVWDDVTQEPNLWDRALAYVQALSLPRSVTVKAIDMSDAGYQVDAYDVGQMVTLDALDTQGIMQVTGITWNLLDPSGGSITFGNVAVTSSSRSAQVTTTANAALFMAGNTTRPKAVTTYTGAASTSTASSSGWHLTSFDTRLAGVGYPSDTYEFVNGVITATRDCVLKVSGQMRWQDTVQGQRGFGAYTGIAGGDSGGTEHSSFAHYATGTTNSNKTTWFSPRVFVLAEGEHITFRRYEQSGAVYTNGENFSWVTVEVVG